MNLQTYDADVYELRKKGTKRPYSDAEGKAYNIPHLACTASEHARFWKCIKAFTEVFCDEKSAHFKMVDKTPNVVFNKCILRFLELMLRDRKFENTRGIEIRRTFEQIKKED